MPILPEKRRTGMRKRLICTTLSILVGGCCLSGTSMAQDASTPILDRGEGAWSSSVLADGLDYPWDIVRDGERLILTEKAGTVVIIEGGNVQRSTLQTSDPLRTEGGAGLLGIALAPDFADSGRAFFYYSYSSGSESANRVVAARFDGNTWRETAVLVDAIPGHRLYNGGRIAIGPDDHLYVTTGWTENYERPQDLQSLAGKVLRLTLAGGVPEDNPFQGSFVYSFGHRNPQGLAWNAEGELFVSEHGHAALDEINLIAPGANYGWPIISGDETQEGMQPPFVHSGGDTWAPSGIAFAGNELLVTALQGRGLYVLDRQARTLQPVVSLGERVRHVVPVGDDLLLITSNRSPRGQGPSKDRLVRLSAQN
ncbi:PQQ-dependent sugar dehydrogenase [Sinorhizobium meliloti]|uniref:PQQ-dependent sugar dehydrogenase n=1 Tax=Rhizobium meliloti TaxID=382 RepID=UPI000B4A4DAA|nr:sorbosone dehydrogenase family protein [Sinorhizobium meliloti]ASP86776.1 dehydrogenase [Sinorhizobium meliloti]ASP93442.1 dehydrogenase [Sinorhizobium meliloti]MQW26552.1 sorbosone dehydrogenase family protein [Sinorhizobium meliloti]MQX60549.1 sorbosone dehydrogenase family protein [Sinorhizobium meliloti]RVJ73480.1 sorbosone dehydrogenase family protein [Sinorhizobium meliloti]